MKEILNINEFLLYMTYIMTYLCLSFDGTFNVGFSFCTSKASAISLRRALLRYSLPITSKLAVSTGK